MIITGRLQLLSAPHFKAEPERLILFLRLLGLIYTIAFLPLLTSGVSLFGDAGLSPFREFLDAAKQFHGHLAPVQFPTLFFFTTSDSFIRLLATAGVLCGLLLASGRWLLPASAASWILWLSFVTAGGDLTSIVWENLLCEAGFLAVLTSTQLRYPVKGGSTAVFFAFLLLNFRLWFSMGWVKFHGGDPAWWQFTFPRFFFQNQPLPAPLSFRLFHAPPWFHFLITIAIGMTEVLMPWLLFHRITRRAAVLSFFILSLAIAFSGNYGFFNWLSMVLLVPLLRPPGNRERKFRLWFSDFLRFSPELPPASAEKSASPAGRWLLLTAVACQLLLQLSLLFSLFFLQRSHLPFLDYPAWQISGENNFLRVWRLVSGWRIANPCGVFNHIQKKRVELVFRITRSDGSEYRISPPWHPKITGEEGGLIAPWYPRFDQHYVYLSNAYSFRFHFPMIPPAARTPLEKRIAEMLLQSNPGIYALFHRPVPAEKPKRIRAELFEARYRSMADYLSDGRKWNFIPLMTLYDSDTGNPEWSVSPEKIIPLISRE